jgi:hypothetical protein
MFLLSSGKQQRAKSHKFNRIGGAVFWVLREAL